MVSVVLVVRIFLCIILISIIPFAIYFNSKIRQNSNETFIQKRSISTLYGFNISSISTIVSSIFVIVVRIPSHHQWAFFYITLGVWFPIFWFNIFFLLAKTWMVYYKYHWTYHTIESQWTQIINKNALPSTDKNQNWFIKNNKQYGNLYYVYKYDALYCSFGCVIINIVSIIYVKYIISTQTHNVLAAIISLILMSVSMGPAILFYAYIAWNTPAWNDVFHICWENKVHAKLLLFLGLTMFSTTLLFIVSGDFIWETVTMTLTSLTLFSMIYVSSVVIIRKNTQKQTLSKNQVTLQHILTNKDAIHLFMVHLSREYSMECLLSLIEIEQFQQFLKQHIKTNNLSISSRSGIIIFPPNIVKSEIIESKEDVQNDAKGDETVYIAKMKAYKLYSKYVKVGSEFEMNIGSEQRQKLVDVLDDIFLLEKCDIHLEDLFELFEECKHEMIGLLDLSLTRYRFTAEYAHLISCINL